MFGIGFTEILLISIIAILFLGPDKLPEALVDMAKFIKSMKKTIGDAKDSFEEEVKLADLKEEALSYKKQLTDATDELKGFKNLSFDDEDDISYDDEISEDSPMDHLASSNNSSTAKKPDEKPNEASTKDSDTQVEKKNEIVTFEKKPKAKKIAQKPKAKKTTTTKKNDKKGEA